MRRNASSKKPKNRKRPKPMTKPTRNRHAGRSSKKRRHKHKQKGNRAFPATLRCEGNTYKPRGNGRLFNGQKKSQFGVRGTFRSPSAGANRHFSANVSKSASLQLAQARTLLYGSGFECGKKHRKERIARKVADSETQKTEYVETINHDFEYFERGPATYPPTTGKKCPSLDTFLLFLPLAVKLEPRLI